MCNSQVLMYTYTHVGNVGYIGFNIAYHQLCGQDFEVVENYM